MMGSDPAIAFQGVTIRRGSEVVVRDVDLAIARGEIVGLLGPSGSGKSTLLLAALSELPVESGSVRVSGSAVPLFQDFKRMLLPWFRVRQNITFGRQESKQFDHVVEILGIESLVGRYTYTLSGGEQQRVALARALLTPGSILLLDEPLSAIDLATRRTVASHVRDFLRSNSIAALWITHHPAEAALVADRVMMMRFGHGPAIVPVDGGPLWTFDA
ncbi:MAG: ATP-binding cassette domain-containing protein [Pseudomonadota bacterium]|nr:ATP-binding cassette domain-containing protein [Pseudomonadota bacterium]